MAGVTFTSFVEVLPTLLPMPPQPARQQTSPRWLLAWFLFGWLTLTWLATSISEKIFDWLTFFYILGWFFDLRWPLVSKAVSINLLYSQRWLTTGYGLDINDSFNGLISIFKIAILFIQLSLYWRSKTILEVPNEYILVKSGNEIEFVQDRL